MDLRNLKHRVIKHLFKIGKYRMSKEGLLYGPKGKLSPINVTSGYLSYSLSANGVVVTELAHRLMWMYFKKTVPDVVNHIDGDKQNNKLQNLEGCTQLQNVHHAIAAGRMNMRGSCNPQAKLNWQDVYWIRGLKKTQRELAEIFNVSRAQIGLIKQHKRWVQ